MKVTVCVSLLLVVSIVLGSGWFVYHDCLVAVGECAPKDHYYPVEVPVYYNNTVYINRTINQTVPPPTTQPPPAQPPGPDPLELNPPIYYHQEPSKYVLNVHYTLQGDVSGTFGAITPYTGNGPPYLVIRAKMVDNTPFNDTEMLPYGQFYFYTYVGFQLCESQVLRFWNWTVLPSQDVVGALEYWSLPTNSDPYAYFQTGESCYARADLTYTADVLLFVEGDGELATSRIVTTDADGDDLPERYDYYYDVRDATLFLGITWP